jgi:hypothetical protein
MELLASSEFLSSQSRQRGAEVRIPITRRLRRTVAHRYRPKSISFRSSSGSDRGRVVVASGRFRYGGGDAGHLRARQRRLAHGLRAGAGDERGRRDEALHAALRGISFELASARGETEPHRRAISPMGCIDNFATHAFHGSKALRAYGERWALLRKWNFNPATDIARDYQGLWRWTGNKPGLRDDVARYFIERSEDGPMLLGETPLV